MHSCFIPFEQGVFKTKQESDTRRQTEFCCLASSHIKPDGYLVNSLVCFNADSGLFLMIIRHWGCIAFIGSGSVFAAKQSIMLYSVELAYETVLVYGLYLTLTRGSKMLHGHCGVYSLVNVIELPVQLYEVSRKSFLTRSVKGNAAPQSTCSRWSLASCQHRRCASKVNDFTNWRSNFAEEGRSNLNIRGTKKNRKDNALFYFECHHEQQWLKCAD